MTQFTVVYDACVLYPAALRDFLMHLAITNLFRARWTDMIHDEWIRNVLKDRPDLEARQLDRTRQLMDLPEAGSNERHSGLHPNREEV